MEWLLTLYIGLTVFGAGVTLMDFLGILGNGDSEGDDGSTDELGEVGDSGGSDSGTDTETDTETDVSAVFVNPEGESGSLVGHDSLPDQDIQKFTRWRKRNNRVSVSPTQQGSGHRILVLLSGARNLVYFSLGFGPTGWYGLGTGIGTTESLLWAGGAGLAALVVVRLLRRLLRSELSSQIKESDLLMENGVVMVSIHPGAMGKVRISLGGSYVDRYARGLGEAILVPGTRVRVIDIEDDCIIVEHEGGERK